MRVWTVELVGSAPVANDRGPEEQLILELDRRGARRWEGGEAGGRRGCCMRAVAESGGGRCR